MTIKAGRPEPLGATPDPAGSDFAGTNFAVFSANATAVTLCLFDGDRERRIPLPERTGDVWHGHVAGVGVGTRYGYRAHGPWAPADGHLFDPAKLLLDPYARVLDGAIRWDDALMGGSGIGGNRIGGSGRDSAPFMPRCVVADVSARPAAHPRTPWSETVIYEAHVKALTALHPDVRHPGTFAALGSDAVLDHLAGLGVTAIELLPAQSFVDDRFLVARDLVNHWGYQTLGFFAPQGRYVADRDPLHGPREFRAAVDRCHARGIEVLMDVVLNHTGESDGTGPHLSFRGLDNAAYYRLHDDGAPVNVTGTGNTLDLSHPAVLRMAMDSLRHWVEAMGVDGFRFDLAPVLGRVGAGEGRFDPRAPLLQAMAQDPVLRRSKLIAEPWDIGPDGYALGRFPAPFAEWNDRFRDDVRGFWRGDGGAGALAVRMAGSADLFDRPGRHPTASVNFVTAHDGYTLHDLAAYEERHNHANGEENRDGHGHNISQNFGVEGPTDDPAILAARARRRRNLLATLLLSQGTPMLLAGDEIGHSQNGNNNAYAQDNETTWLDWAAADDELTAFVARLAALRRAHPALRQTRWLHGRTREDGAPDLQWRAADGGAVDWAGRFVAADLRMAADGADGGPDRVFVVFNGGEARDVTLPATLPDGRWRRVLDTAEEGERMDEGVAAVAAGSVCLFEPLT